MTLKSTLDDIKSRLTALLTYANGVTGESDTSIGDAIETLADGYGQGGSEYSVGANGSIGVKDIYIPDTINRSTVSFESCEIIETYAHNGATTYPQGLFYNCKNLREVRVPKVTTLNTNYLVRQQGSQYNKLETIEIGSVGYPVTSISTKRWRYGSHAMTLTVTIYVNYTSVADIPSDMATNAVGDNSNYAPSGSTVNVVWRNSTTGEVLS